MSINRINHNLEHTINKVVPNGITSKEAKKILRSINRYGYKANKKYIHKLAKHFGFKHYNLSKVGPQLLLRIEKKANGNEIVTKHTKNKLNSLKQNYNKESISKNPPSIQKMLNYAYKLTKMGKAGIIGAKHCTDWVSKVWERTLGIDNADSGKTIFNSMRQIPGRKGEFTGYDAPEQIKKSIKPGDYVALEFKPGNTHGVIALGPVINGRLRTISYPNGGKPPREKTYHIGPPSRTKIVRVKRPIIGNNVDYGYRLASVPKKVKKVKSYTKTNILDILRA